MIRSKLESFDVTTVCSCRCIPWDPRAAICVRRAILNSFLRRLVPFYHQPLRLLGSHPPPWGGGGSSSPSLGGGAILPPAFILVWSFLVSPTHPGSHLLQLPPTKSGRTAGSICWEAQGQSERPLGTIVPPQTAALDVRDSDRTILAILNSCEKNQGQLMIMTWRGGKRANV